MGSGTIKTAKEQHHLHRPKLSQHFERFYYKEEIIFEKPFDWKQAKRLGAFIVPYMRTLVVAMIFMTLATATRLAIPFLISQAIDSTLGSQVKSSFWTGWMMKYPALIRLDILVGTMAFVHLVNWFSNYMRIRTTNTVGQSALYDMRLKLFSHIQSLSLKFFDSRPAGSILVRVTNDVNSLQDLFTSGLVSMLQDVLTLVGIVVIMFSMHVKLAAVCFIFLPFMLGLTGKLRTRIRHGWQMVRIKQARMTAHIAEALQGIRVTSSFHQEEENKEFYQDLNADYRWQWLSVQRFNAWFNPIVEIMGAIGTMVVYWYGTNLLRGGTMTVGQWVAFATYIGQFWEPINRLSQQYGNILVAMASSERICEYLDMEPTVIEGAQAEALPSIAGQVTFDNVLFAYEEGRPALNGVSLEVKPGETVALVGQTGAGKTSIINLLSRFYDVQQGAIKIDGRDIRDVTVESLRSQIAVVLQDTFIFSGTIMENIRFGRLTASDDEVIAAAKAVRAHEFIMRMSEGYQTQVKERGSRLSMGERQLLSFARALIADPRILVLDEATASIDTRTELLIQEALGELLKGRTSFVIAHRLSTIRGANKIVVLDHGRIVEQGDHDSLMHKRGVYHSLIQAQFKFFESA